MQNETERDSTRERSNQGLQVALIDLDEMAFATALFFAAARGQVPLPNAKSNGFELRRDPQIHNLAMKSVPDNLADLNEAMPDEFSLAAGVTVIWHHYEGTEHRQAVCSRLVAFYSLMVRTRGAVADERSHPVEGDPSLIVLDPAVIRAVATAPLTNEGQFLDHEFRRVVLDSERFGEIAMPPALSTIRSKVQLAAPVSGIVEDLVELLFACESTVAVARSAEFSHFRVFEKLCRPFAALSGTQSLQPLLARALALTQPRYPWMASARVTATGRLDGIDKAFLDLHPEEALRGELALMGSLVELLRSLLGDGVTLQLLRSLWPLAFLNTDTPIPVRR